MSSNNFQLKAVLIAVDRISPALKGVGKNIEIFKRQLRSTGVGRGALPLAAGFTAALAVPAKAFADMESAGVQLKNTLMTSDGLSYGFKELSNIATDLGNRLPGTTADFDNMATVMKANSMNTDTLINGGLKAAAYLGVATKDLGETYATAAEGIAKTSNVFGVADKDFISLADSMQRAVNVGVKIPDFTSAMSKAGGPLKALRVQGIGAVNAMAPLIALLTQAGVDPNEAGTGIRTLISTAASAGKFTSIKNLIGDLERMNKLNPAKLIATFETLFGKEHASKAMIIASGGYAEMVGKFKQQADIEMRVAQSLGTLTNIFDSAAGAFQGTMAVFAGTYAPQLKAILDSINNMTVSLANFITQNGPFIKAAIALAGGVVLMKVGMLALTKAVGFASTAMKILNGTMKLNPWMLLIQGLLIAAPLIYENWDKITGHIKSSFEASINWITDKFNAFINLFKTSLESIKNLAPSLSGFFDEADKTQANGMRPPGFQKQSSILSRDRGSVDVKVSFDNSPAGMRVAPAQTRGPVRASQNVGYRTIGGPLVA
ncbi:MAG: phage tail tape measure protein, partial [Methylococcaceae bacterium]|nr:phage tail tape measure protein [Methylococcaceae bacterium]